MILLFWRIILTPTAGLHAGFVMTAKLDWRVAIIGYDPIRWLEYLDRYARQPSEQTRLMHDGRRETHFAQDIDNEPPTLVLSSPTPDRMAPVDDPKRRHVGARSFGAKAEE